MIVTSPKAGLVVLCASLGTALLLCGQVSSRRVPEGPGRPYSAAYYRSGVPGRGGQSVEVFPYAGDSFGIPLPLLLGRVAYSPKGDSLYGEVGVNASAGSRIVRVQFEPTRVTGVSGSAGIGELHSLAITSAGGVVFSGSEDAGEGRSCGVFSIDPVTHVVHKILDDPGAGCRYASAWLRISVSPDGRRAVAVRAGELAVIDLVSGSSQRIGVGFQEGDWSPDGRWIAAVAAGGQGDALFDAGTLARLRDLTVSGARWSPDSRFLLGLTSRGCGSMPYAGTLEMVELVSGKATELTSSKCRVNQPTIGWLSVVEAR
jgi:hypothetical protein